MGQRLNQDAHPIIRHKKRGYLFAIKILRRAARVRNYVIGNDAKIALTTYLNA